MNSDCRAPTIPRMIVRRGGGCQTQGGGEPLPPYRPDPVGPTHIRRLLRARLLTGIEGIRLPSGPPTIINGLDPCAPSPRAPPSPHLLNVASTSHLPDKVGWCGGARNNSSKHDDLEAINCLCKTSVEGTCSEATTPADKEALQRPQGLSSSLDGATRPLIDGCSGDAPPKTTQLLGVGAGAAE
jgi:hypothetical protein